MKNILITACVVIVALTWNQINAEEKYAHFPAIDSPDTSTALCNLLKFNRQLKAITSKKTLTPEDMVKVHELTYTLENAVIRLKQDLDTIAVDLEKVHKASERMDAKTINTAGEDYLIATALLTKPSICN